MAHIYDNIKENFVDGLQKHITATDVKRVDFCVGYFNLRGWDLIVDQIDQLQGDEVEESDAKRHRVCRLLIGMHQPPEELTRWLYNKDGDVPDAEFVRSQKIKIAREFRRQLLLGIPTKKDETTLQRLSQQLKEGKVAVKLYARGSLHAKLYLAHRPDDICPIVGLMGSSNLTFSGLRGQGELNADFTEGDQCKKLNDWFCDRWDDRFCIDITNELIKVLDESWASEIKIPPYYIYLKAAYHLCEEARSGMQEFTLSPEFQRELFPFQETAVKIATRHLRNEKRHGAMIGDVVGLGKTITACAIAKIYETTFASSTLIICPANLQTMWEKYAKKYDLKVDICSMAKSIDVNNARYYRLIIIDESHNLRNGERGSRYKNIKKLIDSQDSAVLLLTATPYNKSFSDIANQLRLFVSDNQDLGIRPETYIRKLGGERAFMQKYPDTFIRSISAFEKSECVEDWNDLMKLFLVRRTRTFIKENHAKTDPENGRKYLEFPNTGKRSYFPDRIPKSLKFKTTPKDQYSRLYSREMLDMMASLELPRYGLSAFISEDKKKEASKDEQKIIDNLSRAGKQQMGFCKSTFFKRIDSCGFSFLLTLSRHILRNMVFVYALENHLKLPISDENQLPDDFLDDDDVNKGTLGDEFDAAALQTGQIPKISTDLEEYKRRAKEYYDFISHQDNVSFIDSRFFKRTLKKQLEKDCEIIIQMIKHCGEWQPEADPKLNLLHKMLTTTHKNEKVVVFTQYSDTANYIYRQLCHRKLDKMAVVTGGCQDPTAEVEKFSPKSNERPDITEDEQYRVLIATDVLSEGQNLQDSHIIISFDLPWAIIRLIQRAGRVDRIGQEADKIYCYSFFPADGVEKIISLRERLNRRINDNAAALGSDEIFFEGNEQNLRDMFNEKAGVLDDESDAEVDLASQAFQIWKNATDANPKLKEIIPALQNMVSATKPVNNASESGVITYVRTPNDFDVLTWYAPDGSVMSHSQKRILQAMACDSDTPNEAPMENHYDLVGEAIKHAKAETADPVAAGVLGNRLSTRFRLVELLNHYYKQDNTLFFSADDKEELKLVINDIYNYPLFDSAKLTIGQMLRRNQDNDEIVQYVMELRRKDGLCHIPTEENAHKDPVIVCSMGMIHDKSE